MITFSAPKQTEQLYEKLLMEAPCAICAARMDGNHPVLFVNRAFFDLFGDIPEEELRSAGLIGALRIAAPKDAELAAREAELVASGDMPAVAVEIRRRGRDGLQYWTMIHMRRVACQEDILLCSFEDITARRKAEEQMDIKTREFQIAAQDNGKTVFRYDIAKKTAYLSKEAAEEYGKEEIRDLPEHVLQNGFLKNESRDAFQKLVRTISGGAQPSGCAVLQMNLKKRKAGYDWYRICYYTIFDRDGAPSQIIVSLRNVTEKYERELAYKKWEQTYASIPQNKMLYLEFDLTRNCFEHSKGGLAGPLPDLADPTMEAVLGNFINEWVYPADRAKLANHTSRARLLRAYFRNSQISDMEYRNRREDGSYGWVRVSIQMLPDPYSSNIRAFLLFQDIDSSKQEELSLQDRLRSDPLTGVLNRKAFIEAAEQICPNMKEGSICAFVMIDVDNFKQVNDRFGHAYGDRVLMRIADTLRSSVRSSDLVARMGGDEFLLLLQDVVDKDALIAKLTYLREQIYQRVSSDIVISCSFGTACCPADGKTFDKLYFKSDLALYTAKEDGRNRVCIYNHGLRPKEYLRDAEEI